ncbi:MAG: hypothetical protein SCM11_11530 [Bacillota bacterium]|nr:hypothetical protein [Bacillota bacterium]
MNEELRKILDLVEQKTITAAQAAELLEAMGLEDEAKAPVKPKSKRLLRIIVLSADGHKINIKLPVSILRSSIDIGKHFGAVSGEGKDTLNNLDWDNVITMVDQMVDEGSTGEIVNINSANGDKVLILLE